MNDESQKPEQDFNQIDFPNSLFSENKPAEPVSALPSAPIDSDSRRNLGLVIGILSVLCCLIVALGAGGFYFISQGNQMRDAQSTVTAAAVAQAQATNQAYAKSTIIAQATQSKAAAIAQATLDAQASATAQAETQATAAAQSTLEANTTATVVAHQTERAQYPLIEKFDNNKRAWYVGKTDSDYYVGTTSVANGVYVWDITTAKQTFISWESYKAVKSVGDFDVYVDGRLKAGDPQYFCYGMMFREDPRGFENGAYVFEVCENGNFEVSYYNKDKSWQEISGWQNSDAIKAGDWNRLEISARGSHFVFTVNDVQVYEMDDDRQAKGYISVLIDVYKELPGTVWFDNFGLKTP